MPSTQTSKRLAFAIHDLNPWGGHDRSNLEILRRLSHSLPIDLYSFTLNDPEKLSQWGTCRHHKIWPDPGKPQVFRLAYFHALLPFLTSKVLGAAPLCATGACSLTSDFIQVQFIHAAWEAIRKTLPPEINVEDNRMIRRLYHRFMTRYGLLTEHIAYQKHKTYIAIAHCVANDLKTYFQIPEQKIHVIHHGVDKDLFSPPTKATEDERKTLRAKHGVQPNEIAIAFIGAYERKGLGTVIKAIGKLPKHTRSKLKLLAVGGGSISKFTELAKMHDVSEQVILVGHQKQIAAYYRACDLFLLPTYYEPFGLVILEAMASGLAPIVSRCAGASELIENEKSGLLIEQPFDADEVANKLERLIHDDALRNQFSQAARSIAENRTWDHVAQDYANFFSQRL